MRKFLLSLIVIVSCGWIHGNHSAHTGLLATRLTMPSSDGATGLHFSMSAEGMFARTDITSLQVIFANWQIFGNGEFGSGDTLTLTASVEYPLGTFTQLTFGGNPTATIADNTNAISDSLTISIPNGALFRVRMWQQLPVGNIQPGLIRNGPSMGDATILSATSTPDLTLGGTITSGGVGSQFTVGPLAVIGPTNKPTIGLVGDSRAWGAQDTVDASGDLGDMARSVGPDFAYFVAAVPGQTAQGYTTNSTHRSAIINSYCTHVIVGYGINDIIAGRTALQVEGNLQTIWGLYPTLKVYQVTMEPDTTSTDSWATLVNQTNATGTARVAVNDWIKGKPVGIVDFFDIGGVGGGVESSSDSTLWTVNGVAFKYTPDGIHPNQFGYLTQAASGAIPVGAFTWP